jgi:ABC-2 type transport system ATP-binding protein
LPSRRLDPLRGAGRGLRLPRPNGAGKTTTPQAADAADLPHVGHRRDPRAAGRLRRGEAPIGYLPENPYFYDHLTAEELLEYFASLFGYAGPERRTRASRLLDEVGIGAERRLQLRKFSKGMLQRVGIAQALVNDPEVVFFDEPMSASTRSDGVKSAS